MQTRFALAMSMAMNLAILGCVAEPKIEYVELQPRCEKPAFPRLPSILNSSIPDELRPMLLERERLLVDWATELEAIVDATCAMPKAQ